MTMQAVSQTTGIAKTTIYRRHRDRRALLTSALEHLAQQPPMDPQSTQAERLTWVIRQSVDVIANGIGAGGFAALLTNEDPDFSEVFREILVTYREQALAVLAPDTADGDIVVDMIVGSYIAQLARTGTVDETWGDRVFTRLND